MDEYILVVSDSHLENKTLYHLTNKFKETLYKFHCGDSNLNNDNPLLNSFQVVCGNHDNLLDFPPFIVLKPFIITHGHKENVYFTDELLVKLAKNHDCTVVFHGHTHIPRDQYIDNIHIINPGSLLINRGSYGYATYGLYHIKSDTIRFYRTSDDSDVTDEVLADGIHVLNEIRNEED